MNDLTTSQRIEYIDSLKGFLILSVVMCHVSGYCLNIQADIPTYQFILFEFRNPPFFFISGFLAYKAYVTWDITTTLNLIKKKIISVLWPTIIFTAILLYIHPSYKGYSFLNHSITDIWIYWFTLSLFLFFFLYYFLESCMVFIKSEKTKSFILLIIGLFFYCLFLINSIYESLPFSNNVKHLFGMGYWGYFFFFSIGVLARKHNTLFRIALDNIYALGTCILLFIVMNIFNVPLRENHYNLFRITTYLTGIILVFSFFRTYPLHRLLKKSFVITGKRTLDIYLIHYFFLPLSLIDYSYFLHSSPMPLIEFTITLFLSIIIIVLSLLVSYIIRLNPISSSFFFGIKQMQKT